LKPKLVFETCKNSFDQRFERFGVLDPRGDVLHRLHGEDRAGADRVQIAVDAAIGGGSGFFRNRIDCEHFVHVGGTQLENAFQSAIGSDGFDSQRHPLEQGAFCF
jgi:hypothetical protein